MYLPLPIFAALGILFLALVILLVRRRSGDRDLVAPPRLGAPTPPPWPASRRQWPADAAPIGDMPEELQREVRALLDSGNKIEAIKLVREATHLGLAEAKQLVERM